ncbi:MAG: peptidyl-prolyl cis-trans isomerase, partial [Verrucomicrobia bacterium]|nr:peptidyl-prolyl cis-trans isomerase [Cytophagales bacterium]
DLIKNTPFQGIPNKVQFLKQNVYAEQSQSNQTYLLRILAYKISDQPSPLTFVRQQVKEVIVNRRKVTLMRELEKNIYEKAKNEKKFEIYGK